MTRANDQSVAKTDEENSRGDAAVSSSNRATTRAASSTACRGASIIPAKFFLICVFTYGWSVLIALISVYDIS
jgi:hypothetical protein